RGRHLLRHPANPCPRRDRDIAALQRQLTPDQAEQSGLARAIAADKANLMAGGNGGRCALEQGTAFDIIGDIINAQHGPALPQPAGKVNAPRPALALFQNINIPGEARGTRGGGSAPIFSLSSTRASSPPTQIGPLTGP